MLCPLCQGPAKRSGRNRNGSQRHRCAACARTFTDATTRPTDRRGLAQEKLLLALRLLLEGNSVRSTERLTGVHRDTILRAMVTVGERCEKFLTAVLRGLTVADVQADEIWGFVAMKEKTRKRACPAADALGDAYCYVAIERTTKLVLAWHLGKRSPLDTHAFAEKLYDATRGRFQLTTDGYHPYQQAIPATFHDFIDYAQLVKQYGNADDDHRYSPAQVVGIEKLPRIGNPDAVLICTSHVERQNLTMRMQIRRLTRLTNAFSKKWGNHRAALALWFAYYNFCRVHGTLKSTPAAGAGLAVHTWSLGELLAATQS